MPAAASGAGSASALNCGLARERGTERTSTRRSTPASCNSPISSPIGRVEWPIVKIGFAGPAPLSNASIHMLAAIDRQGRAGDETGFVRDQEQDGAGDVLGLAEAADRDARDDLLEDVLRHRAHHLGID